MLNQFHKHEDVIASNINEVIYNICDNFKRVRKDDQNKIIKIFNKLFNLNYFFSNLQSDTILSVLDLLHDIPSHLVIRLQDNNISEFFYRVSLQFLIFILLQDMYVIEEILEDLIKCAPRINLARAFVERMSQEKAPIIQVLIKKLSQVVKISNKSDIRPFLDKISSIFQVVI